MSDNQSNYVTFLIRRNKHFTGDELLPKTSLHTCDNTLHKLGSLRTSSTTVVFLQQQNRGIRFWPAN